MAFLKRAAESEKKRAEAFSLFAGGEEDEEEDQQPKQEVIHTKPVENTAALKAAAAKLLLKQKQQKQTLTASPSKKVPDVVHDKNGEVLADYGDSMEDDRSMPPPPSKPITKTPVKKDLVVTRPPEPNQLNLTAASSAITNGLSLDPAQNKKQLLQDELKKQQQEPTATTKEVSTLFSFHEPPAAAAVKEPDTKKVDAMIIEESSQGKQDLSSSSTPAQQALAATEKKTPVRRARVKTKAAPKQATSSTEDMDTKSDQPEPAPEKEKKKPPSEKKKSSKPKEKKTSSKPKERKQLANKSSEPAAVAAESKSDAMDTEPEETKKEEPEPGLITKVWNTFTGRGKKMPMAESPPAAVPDKAGKGGVKLAKRHQNAKKKLPTGLTKASVRRLARRGGVQRINAAVYAAIEAEARKFLKMVIGPATLYCEHEKRKTLQAEDVHHALAHIGRPMYSADMSRNGRFLNHVREVKKKIKNLPTPDTVASGELVKPEIPVSA